MRDGGIPPRGGHAPLPGRLRALGVAVLLAAAACEPLPDGAADPAGWPFPPRAPAVRADSAMVATVDAHATRVGVEVLRRGGNAVDAAVATAFALAVVNPEAGNLGGGGFMVIRLADGSSHALDFRERAPLAATRDMYLDERGELTDASRRGHLAAGVPGTVMGLWEAHRRFGTVGWAELLAPAIALAAGFTVESGLARSLGRAAESLSRYPASREAFLPGGEPPAEGEVFRQPDLMKALARIRSRGPDGFYRGDTARLIVREMRRGGGIITAEDLASYEARWREPVRVEYRGYTLHSMPPPSSGGATLALISNILEDHELSRLDFHSVARVHVLAEALRRAYADRNEYLADPDYVELPLERFVSEAYATERGADISPSAATPSSRVGPGALLSEGTETTHFSVVDPEGNAVALTTTINSLYGSRVTVEGAGFLLNNEMDDFTTRPGSPNLYGLVQGERNAIEPGKRMLSAMTPTVVEDPEGNLLMVVGSPGGSTIITTVFQVISNVLDFGMSLPQAVNAPRVHHQHLPDRIQFERGGLLPAVVDSLRAMGHEMDERGGTSGDVKAILVLPEGSLAGYADPRRGGLAAGF